MATPPTPGSLVVRTAERFGVDADKLLVTLRATAFRPQKGSPEATNEQMMALLIVADQYGLNPFTREIFAFPDKKSGIVPVVSVDGWIRIIQGAPGYDGCAFAFSDDLVEIDGHEMPAWIECTIYRRDQSHPTTVREWAEEVYRPPYRGINAEGKAYVTNGPWQTHRRRMMRHKALIQCGRVAFGFGGIYDEDEAERIAEAQIETPVRGRPTVRLPRARNPLTTNDPAQTQIYPPPPPEAPYGPTLAGAPGSVGTVTAPAVGTVTEPAEREPGSDDDE